MPRDYRSSFSDTGSDTAEDEHVRKCRKLLRAFASSSPHIEGCALVSNDGFIIASVLNDSEVDEDRFGAMCASLLSLATRAASEIQRGDLRQIILDGSLGPMLLTRVNQSGQAGQTGQMGVLAVATSPQANLGKVILDTRNAARALSELS
jgi:hypothetical protein